MEKYLVNEKIIVMSDKTESSIIKYYKNRVLQFELIMHMPKKHSDTDAICLVLIDKLAYLCKAYNTKCLNNKYYTALSEERDKESLNNILNDITYIGRIITILKTN